jgi:hypothetical protein
VSPDVAEEIVDDLTEPIAIADNGSSISNNRCNVPSTSWSEVAMTSMSLLFPSKDARTR